MVGVNVIMRSLPEGNHKVLTVCRMASAGLTILAQRQGLSGIARLLWVWLAVLVTGLFAPPALAQSTFTFTSNATATINQSTTCTAPIVRNFNVTNSFTVGGVDLGVYATHSWRGDLRITLQAPDGTRVQLVDGESGAISGDNFNVLLDDSATQTVNTDSATGNHAASMPPPFANTFRPDSPLSAFNGKSSVGTWRVEICDIFPSADNGTLRYVALYLGTLPANTIDLSLSQSVSNTSPTFGQTISYTLSVSSASYSTQSANVTIGDLLPAGATYVSHSGSGTYVAGTGVWTVTGLAAGQTRTLTIVAQVAASAGATITNTAEIISASATDIDSTPGNGLSGEDDQASASFTVAGTRIAGTPPTLVCSQGFLQFDWTGRSWPGGSTANNYTLAGFGAFNWSISNPATWMNIATLGGQQPALTTAAQSTLALSIGIDFADRAQLATTTISLGAIVDGAQFTIFDVDYAANDFADFIRVTGRRGATTVTPVLTNGVSNYVIGNAAYGDAASAESSANGNVVVTFNQPIDQIIIEYGNHAAAPANPDGQAVQMAGGISVCKPVADIAVSKTSEVLSDPVSGVSSSAFAIPGARVRYCITLQNGGSATASSLTATDLIPASVAFVAGSMRSGATCALATTVEDENASGADDADAIGASFAAGQVNLAIASLASGESAALTFEVLVQ